MQRLYFPVFLILLFMSVITSCKQGVSKKSSTSPERFLILDEKPDSIYPAGIVELSIPSSGSEIYGFEYSANGEGPHPTVIFLHGLPGNERNLDIGQNLRRAGYNIIYFNYRGSWGSEGTFSYSNSLKDIDAVIEYIRRKENSQHLKVDSSRIALLGHSMGAGMALIKGISHPNVKAIAALSVFNPYTALKGSDGAGNLLEMKQYLSTLGMLKCQPDVFLNELLSNIKSYNIDQIVGQSQKPMLIIDEHEKNNYLAKYSSEKNLKYKIWNTDHAFTNKRIALSSEIKSWLDRNLSKSK